LSFISIFFTNFLLYFEVSTAKLTFFRSLIFIFIKERNIFYIDLQINKLEMTNHREAKSVDWCCYLRRQLLYLLPVFACRKPGLMSCIWCSQFGGPSCSSL